jgi:hypothetical protein
LLTFGTLVAYLYYVGKGSLARFLGGFGYIESQTTALWLEDNLKYGPSVSS